MNIGISCLQLPYNKGYGHTISKGFENIYGMLIIPVIKMLLVFPHILKHMKKCTGNRYIVYLVLDEFMKVHPHI